MNPRWLEKRPAWLVVGLLCGAVVSMYWPHEQAQATAVDRSSKIAVITVPTVLGSGDAVFILDFVTGRLVGASYNTQVGDFTNLYFRNVAADFRVSENAEYAIVPGDLPIQGGGASQPAQGSIYVAELNSGKIALYGFAVNPTGARGGVQPLVPMGGFSFRTVTE